MTVENFNTETEQTCNLPHSQTANYPSNVDLYDEITKITAQLGCSLLCAIEASVENVDGSLWAASDIVERFSEYATSWYERLTVIGNNVSVV